MKTPARRIAAGAIFFLAAVHVRAGTPAQQPLLRAPWIGTAKISQGNNDAAHSHRDHGTWDNTYAIDLTKRDAAGNLIRFKVLAPADGVM